MKAKEYEKAECSCGWFCHVLRTAKADVFHCGNLCTKTAGGKEVSDE